MSDPNTTEAAMATTQELPANAPAAPLAAEPAPTDNPAVEPPPMNGPVAPPAPVAPNNTEPAADAAPAEDAEAPTEPPPPPPRYLNFLSALAANTPADTIPGIRLHPETDPPFETHSWTTPTWPVRPTAFTGKALQQFKLIVAPRYHQYFAAAAKTLTNQERDRVAGQATVRYLQLLQNGERLRDAVRARKERAKAEGEARKRAEGQWESRKGKKGKGPQGVGFPMRPVTRKVKRKVTRVIKPEDPDWWSESEDEEGPEEEPEEREDDEDEDEEVVLGPAEKRQKKGKPRVVVEEVEEQLEVDTCAASRERVARGEGTEEDMNEIEAMYEWLAVEEGRAR